ncbi:hypothetical protein OHQ89_17340 [Streptomyces canus]
MSDEQLGRELFMNAVYVNDPGQFGVGDRQGHQLSEGESRREGTTVPFDEMGNDSLHTADDAAVDHDRAVAGAVRADVVQVELLGLVEATWTVDRVDSRPAPPVTWDVGLGAVERGLSLGWIVGQADVVENVGRQGGGPLPLLDAATYLTFGPGREPVTGRGDTERLVRLADISSAVCASRRNM